MYSKIPMPPADWEKENMKYALCFFPWVGLVIGAVSTVLFWLLEKIGAGNVFRAAVLTAVPVLVTGGIHLDGYLDTMDALSSWREKQRRLWQITHFFQKRSWHKDIGWHASCM